MPFLAPAQKKVHTTTTYPNGDVVENAAAKTDTIQLCGKWTAVGRMEKGMKEGWWEFYNDKLLCYRGTYRKGVKQGEWISESPHAKLNYKDGKLDGEIIYYHFNSIAIEQRRHYVAGKAHGDWITYAEDGKTRTEIRHYQNDKPVGTWEIQYGQLLYKGGTNEFGYHGQWTTSINDTIVGGGNYVNGVKEGEWIDMLWRHEKSIGRYVNGKQEGLWRWYRRGQLEKSCEFVNGIRHGADTMWSDGNIIYITHWYENRLDGAYTHFYRNGNKESEYVYDRATRDATYREFDEEGKLTMSGQLKFNPDYLILEADRANDCSVYVYDEYELELVEHGICWWHCTVGTSHEKPDVTFDSTLSYFRSEQFRKDTMGPHRPWNTPSHLRTGVWTEYYPGKKKKEEGMYDKRVDVDVSGNPVYFKTGWWNVYEESGTLLRQELYENGVLIETRNRKK